MCRRIKNTLYKHMTEIIMLLLLVLLNAFFAMTEIAYVSLNDAKIDMMAKSGDKKAIKIKKLLDMPSKFLATIQIGITLAGFLSSAFAADTFADKIAPALTPLLGSSARSISIVLITIILSFISLIFGELVPKRIGMKYHEKIAFATAGIIRTISIILAPFVKLLTGTTNLVSKLFGVTENDEEVVTEEEIRMMVDAGEEKGAIEEEEKEMINNVFEFNDIVVSEIMVPRNDLVAVDLNLTIGELFDELGNDRTTSRIPLYEDDLDNIKGILHIKDVLNKPKETKLKDLMREAYYVPETKKINELFDEFKRQKIQMAIVIDEYGGTAGIVTMEDVLEEIVGDIYDEYDEVENLYEVINENTYIFDAGIPIYDLSKILEIDIEEGDYDTLSGYILENLGRLPKEGEHPIIKTDKFIMQVEEVKDNRILTVKVEKIVVEENLE
ncbi:MAG: HlyC/CorC family transporter [Clostridia bacterium]|nr:HlyC/CorC family transporter [Clostridia bacterium]